MLAAARATAALRITACKAAPRLLVPPAIATTTLVITRNAARCDDQLVVRKPPKLHLLRPDRFGVVVPHGGWRLWCLVTRRLARWLALFGPVACWAPAAYVLGLRRLWFAHLLWATEAAGPTVTKLAQWSATRRDVFPGAFCDHMERLQGAARPHGRLDSELALLDALGAGWRNRVAIEPEPVGSGVVAQVHRGVYEGRRVAVKLVHPATRRAVSEDLAVLAALARAADGLAPSIAKFLDPVGLVDDFSEKMGRSSSMEFEADALRKLRKNFSREAGVAIPEPFLARRGALVESFEDGLPLAECLRALEGAPEAKAAKRAIAARGLRALLKMLFVDNCVHCDMHSGNLLVRPHGADVAASVARGAFDLVILDAGLTLELERRDLVNFVDLFAAVVRRDGRACGHLLLDRARYHECDDREAFAADVDRLIKAATSASDAGLSVVTLGELDIGRLLFEVLDVCRRHRVRLEAKFATTVVAITIVEGIGRNLDPDLDLLREAAPFLLSRAALKAI